MKLLQYIAILAGVLAALTAATFLLAPQVFGSAAQPALWWAAGGSGLAALLGLLPLGIVLHLRMYPALPQAALAGMVLRLLLTGAFTLGVTRLTDLPYWPFVGSLMVFYFGLLVAETTIAVSCARYLTPPAEGRAV